jgi:hypothetical protein
MHDDGHGQLPHVVSAIDGLSFAFGFAQNGQKHS